MTDETPKRPDGKDDTMNEDVEKVDQSDMALSRRDLMGSSAVVAAGAMGIGMMGAASAQDGPTDEISGTVEDTDGNAVDGATVVAVPHDESLDALVTTTDENGDYLFATGDLHPNGNLYHVVARDGTEADPFRSQQNYPFIAATGETEIPDSDVYQDADHRWLIDENTGPAITDEIGSVDGTIDGSTWVTGTWEGDAALEHDGSNDKVVMDSTIDGLSLSESWTVALTVRESGDDAIFLNHYVSDSDQISIASDAGELSLGVYDGSWTSANTTLEKDTKLRVIMAHDPNASPPVRGWVNGSEISSGSDSSGILGESESFQLGQALNKGDPWWADGEVDHVVVWYEAKDDQTATDDYNAQPWSPTFVFDSRLDDMHAHQGVASDGTYLYTSSSNDDDVKALTKSEKDGTQVDQRLNPEEDGTTMTQVSDLSIIDGQLYGTSNNYSAGRDDGYVKVWDPNDLSYVEEHQVAGDVAEGVGQYDGDFWVVYNDADRVDRYDSNWSKANDYALSYDTGNDWGYQGIAWVGDYIYVNMHEGGDSPETCDVYEWNGGGFDEVARLEPPTADTHQGLGKEPGEGVMWWAERDSGGTGPDDVVKSTFNHTNGDPSGD